MSWILFSILAALIWAVVNIIDKYILTKWVKNPLVPTIIIGVVGFTTSLFIYIFHGFSYLSFVNILLAIISGVFILLACIFYFKAVKIEEISRVIPIFYFSPAFIAVLAAIFLGEVFSPLTYLGIIFLIIGAMLISSKNLKKISFGKSFWFMVISAFLSSIYSVITKYLLNFTDFWTVFAYFTIGSSLATIPIFFLYFPDLLAAVKEHGKRVVCVISLSETLNLLALFLFTIAKKISYVTLINALSSVQPFFVLLFAVMLSVFYPKILREEVGKSTVIRKSVAIVLMFVGVLLIT